MSSSEEITLHNVPEWLHQSEQYIIMLNEQEHTSFSINSTFLKCNTIVNNIDDFTHIITTCNYWGIDYPKTLFNFIDDNRELVLEYLSHYEDNLSFKLLIKYIIKIKFCAEIVETNEYKTQEEDEDESNIFYISPLYGHKLVITFKGVFEYTPKLNNNMVGIYSYIIIFERFVRDLKDPSIDLPLLNIHRSIRNNGNLHYSKSDSKFYEFIPTIININELIISCECFIEEMKNLFNKFEITYGNGDMLRKNILLPERPPFIYLPVFKEYIDLVEYSDYYMG